MQNRFLRGEKLGQLFLIDHYMRMLNQRYSFIRDKCGEYLTSTKNKMLKARQRLADKLHLGITIGAQFSVPHTVPGSPRWLQQKFENAVAMCNAFGRPDLFITATCNVKWPEIKVGLVFETDKTSYFRRESQPVKRGPTTRSL